ncbi:MAG: YraN family protein, partial [Gemmatimonadetes bacterium]|nr:YraN family protein [Gemmatimonadota bacterium]
MTHFRKVSMDRAEVGRRGEEEAAAYLVARGWTILARNHRWGRKEIDLIAQKGRITAFVEVKCR